MFVVFEGLDKTGKGTLEWEFLKATNFKHVVIDRGPMGYMTFDKLLGRETKLGNQEFIHQARKMTKSGDFMVVYCRAGEEAVNERLKAHNEQQLDCGKSYIDMQQLYDLNVRRYYKQDVVLWLDTDKHTVGECIELICQKLKEVRRSEYN